MPRWLDNLEQFAVDVILERRFGKKAAVFRVCLRGLGVLYLGGVQSRLALYRNRILKDHQLGCPVITVGNLTVGGTGKTPVVEMLARNLAARGRKVAILSRGYKSSKPPILRRMMHRLRRNEPPPPRVVSDGKTVLLDSRLAGDEPHMLAKNLPGVIVITDKDRVKGGRHALENWAVDTILLDDGFQHVRLKHRLDIVLIDSEAPFGNEYLLPRGTLREPPRNLRRAHTILVTKSGPQPDKALIKRIRQYNRTADIIECRHRPVYLQHVYTEERQPLEFLKDRYIGSVSGIARPESFEQGLVALGARLEIAKRYADHHRFNEKEMGRFVRRCVQRDLAAIITTEKDAVRFPRLDHFELPVYFLRVEIEILRGREHWERLLDRLCGTSKNTVPSLAPQSGASLMARTLLEDRSAGILPAY